MDTLSLIAPMLGVVAVIIAAYLTTKWLATRSTIKVADGKRIHVIERVPLTRDTYLALVRVRSKTYLLSVGPSHVEQIGELDGGAGAPGERRRPEDDFESLLSQRMRSFRDERRSLAVPQGTSAPGAADADEKRMDQAGPVVGVHTGARPGLRPLRDGHES
jgi:flagellar biogenesis protein FliO